MKCSLLLLLFQLILITIGQPLDKLDDIDATSGNIVYRRAHRYPRALKPDLPTCGLNQYFDEDEGRCLGVTGGGRVLYINSTNSCGINILQPHCTNPSYYYICKNNKTILAQCLQEQHFENRLQKCVNVHPDKLISSTVQPNLKTFEAVQLPECEKPGSFPVPDDCTLFYTCETNGHRMFQNIFSCPNDMAYNVETKMCSFSSSCKKGNSNVPFCAPAIQKKRHVEESTSTESVTRITDLDDTDKAVTYEISTEENVEDTTVRNTVSVTIYDNDVPTSTFSSNDFTSTEFTKVTDSTEHTSYMLHSLDTETSTAYSVTSEKELSSKEEMNQFMETTTILDSTYETEQSVEGSTTEAVTETSIVNATASSKEIQTTEIDKTDSSLEHSTSNDQYSTTVTEDIVEQSITTVGSTEVITTTSTADLSTSDNVNVEVQTTTKTEMNDSLLESSTPEDSELNEQSSVMITEGTEVNDEGTAEHMEVEQDVTETVIMNKLNDDTNPESGSLVNDATAENLSVSTENIPTSNEMEFTDSLTTESNNEENESADTKPTFLPTTTISTSNRIQESAVDSNTKNVSSISTIVAVSNSENNKQNASSKGNDITEEEFVTALKTIHSTGRISADIILPIMSAVLSIIDTIERCLIHILSKIQS